MTSLFRRCIASETPRVYDKVQPAEVCSYETVKKLGINNIILSNETINNRISGTCIQSQSVDVNEAIASPYCIFSSNAGFGFVSDGTNKCRTIECPTGFTLEKNSITCTKPSIPAVIQKSSRCDGQAEDWFMIPNHHLGNKFNSSNSDCYAPCGVNSVPFYHTDPVDGQIAAWVSAPADQTSRCVSKNNYFMGKYANTSDFCPLAWIKRISSTPDEIQDDMKNEIYSKHGSNCADLHTDFYKDMIASLPMRADEVANKSKNRIENVPLTVSKGCEKQYLKADGTINTDRISKAYKVCSSVQQDPDAMKETFKQTFGDTDDIANFKIRMLNQACQATFYNTNPGNPASLIQKPALYFQPSDTANMDMTSANRTPEQIAEDEENAEAEERERTDNVATSVKAEKIMETNLRGSGILAVKVFIVAMMIIFLIYYIFPYLWPLLQRFWYYVIVQTWLFIKYNIFRYKRGLTAATLPRFAEFPWPFNKK